MAILTEPQLQRLLDRVLILGRASKGAELAVAIRGVERGFTRFANNEITSAGNVERLTLSVTMKFGLRAATATTNQLDDRSLDELVGRAGRMARLSPENPEALPLLGKQVYLPVKAAVDAATAKLTPEARARAVAAALAAGDAAKVAIAGFYEHATSHAALATTSGLFARHHWTSCGLSCTARTPDGTGSGWAGTASNRVGDLDAGLLARTAVDKATRSAKPRRLDPGKYTVVLEPAAVASLMAFLTSAFNARRADEGRSFFTKPGPTPGRTKLGDKLFPDTITLRTNPLDGALAALPYDGDGIPQAPRTWIDKGVVAALAYSRFWGKQQQRPATGTPDGWQLDGGTATRDDLIKGVKRGVLITRLWYLRSLDQQTILVTGLTRDGTFLIENGAIAGPVNNFRFNDSPIQMLAKCDGLTAGLLTPGDDGPAMRAPALRTHEFNLASISEAV